MKNTIATLLFKKLCAALGLTLIAMTSAHASYTSYANQTSFLSAVTNAKIDNWVSAPNSIFTDAKVSALSAGNIRYVATGFPDFTVVTPTIGVCFACNGSGYMDLTATNVGTAYGVFGFSVAFDDFVNPLYNAYVTFGDNSILSYTNLSGRGFIGITSTSLIKKVEFARSIGQASTDGGIFFPQVTVAAQPGVVPEPMTPVLIGLGLLGLIALRRKAEQ